MNDRNGNGPKRWRVHITYMAPAEARMFECESLAEIADLVEPRDDAWAVQEIRIDIQRHDDVPQWAMRDWFDRGFALVPVHMLTSDQVKALDTTPGRT